MLHFGIQTEPSCFFLAQILVTCFYSCSQSVCWPLLFSASASISGSSSPAVNTPRSVSLTSSMSTSPLAVLEAVLSPSLFIKILASGLGYPENGMEHIVVGFHLVVIAVTFLIISLATFLNQFKPEIYLDLSVAWRHSVALPTIGILCIIVEAFILYHCSSSLENECFKITIRRFVLVPIPCLCFILQCIVLIDDVYGLKNVFKFANPTNQTPVNPFQNPSQGLQNHVVCNR